MQVRAFKCGKGVWVGRKGRGCAGCACSGMPMCLCAWVDSVLRAEEICFHTTACWKSRYWRRRSISGADFSFLFKKQHLRWRSANDKVRMRNREWCTPTDASVRTYLVKLDPRDLIIGPRVWTHAVVRAVEHRSKRCSYRSCDNNSVVTSERVDCVKDAKLFQLSRRGRRNVEGVTHLQQAAQRSQEAYARPAESAINLRACSPQIWICNDRDFLAGWGVKHYTLRFTACLTTLWELFQLHRRTITKCKTKALPSKSFVPT